MQSRTTGLADSLVEVGEAVKAGLIPGFRRFVPRGRRSVPAPGRFLRVHRSAIVRVDAIQALERLSNNEFAVVLAGGTRLVSSRGYRERIEELLRRSR